MPLMLIPALTQAFVAYITPEEAGFRDCMLIYESRERGAEALLPYVAHLDAEGVPDEWLFDAFLFLRFGQAPSGPIYYNGPTNWADWLYALDAWFAPGRDIAALQEAVTAVRKVLGPPPRPLQVVLSTHYPHSEQVDFGDADGDGRSEDFTDPAARARAVACYVDEAVRRFEDAAHPDLELWGFYWMNEDIGPFDAEAVRLVADVIHERGMRFLWIPYFRAQGYDRWRELGFDVAILQPNYAFLEQHQGRIRNDRLIEAAAIAEEHGAGVEIEAGSVVTDPRAREMFLDYLAFGSDALCGYARAAKAYYQGHELFRGLQQSPDPSARAAYGAVADFVAGRPVARPGALTGARAYLEGSEPPELLPGLTDGLFVTQSGPEAPIVQLGRRQATFRVDLADPVTIHEVELSFLADASAPWSGLVEVSGLRPGTNEWEPGGWRRALVASGNSRTTRKCVVAVPVRLESVRALSVQITGSPGTVIPPLDEISVVRCRSGGTRDVEHIARGCSYVVEPDIERKYPDRGGQLTDGLVSTEGFWEGRSVGWYHRDVTIALELDDIYPVESVVVRCDGGGYAAVLFPSTVEFELAADSATPPFLMASTGTTTPSWAAGGVVGEDAFVIDGRQPRGDHIALIGHVRWSPDRPVPARRVVLRLSPHAWLMVSEVEVLSGGRNLALGARYAFRPLPDAVEEVRYADDGVRLADGYIADSFEPHVVTGWAGQSARVTVDLGVVREIREIAVHSLGGGYAGIYAPRAAAFLISNDGMNWHEVGTVEASDPGGDTSQHVELRVAATGTARYVRASVEPSRGWLMLSELEVR